MNEMKNPIKDTRQEEIRSFEERAEELQAFIETSPIEEVKKYLAEKEPEDIADILSEFSTENKIKIFNALDVESAAVVLDDTDPQTRLQILQKINNEDLAKVLGEMPADEVADVIEEVSEEDREDLLELLKKEEAEDVEEILRYPEDSAGRIMNPEFISVGENDEISSAIDHIRGLELDEDVHYVYVVNDNMELKGLVPLRKLLTSRPGTKIDEIMEKDLHSISVETDQEEAANVIRKYDVVSLPVTNSKGQLVGRITVDDIIDVIDEERAEDISKMTGTIEEEHGTESTLRATQNRLPWLIACMFGSIVTGLVIQMFEVTLAETIALVSFIPVITATGGNSGVQASTVVVRSIALGHMDFNKVGEEIVRQLKIALSLGIVCAVVLSVLASFWKQSSAVGIITGLSILLVVVWSNFVGVFAPVMLKKFNIDPAIASGPFITTLNDIIGVFIYLFIAAVFLH